MGLTRSSPDTRRTQHAARDAELDRPPETVAYTGSRRTRFVISLLVVLVLLAGWDGWRWSRAAHGNEMIASGRALELGDKVTGRARFAQAVELNAKGDWQGALARYQSLELDRDGTIALAARYNAGNVYLREALAAGEDKVQSLPLVELAKRAYREVLRADPDHWDARYNLERALRLAPDAADESSGEGPAPRQSERAVTTMRGFSAGLP